MKARLAKKLGHTPIERLAPYWINKFVCTDGRDARFKKAFAKWNKRKNEYTNNRKRKRTQNILLLLMYIKVNRRNRPDCIVMICKDRATKKWCYVNLSTEHVCACRFDTIDDALADMKKREDVESFSEIDNPLVYEQTIYLHGASLFEVLKKNKEFRGRL